MTIEHWKLKIENLFHLFLLDFRVVFALFFRGGDITGHPAMKNILSRCFFFLLLYGIVELRFSFRCVYISSVDDTQFELMYGHCVHRKNCALYTLRFAYQFDVFGCSLPLLVAQTKKERKKQRFFVIKTTK